MAQKSGRVPQVTSPSLTHPQASQREKNRATVAAKAAKERGTARPRLPWGSIRTLPGPGRYQARIPANLGGPPLTHPDGSRETFDPYNQAKNALDQERIRLEAG